MSSPEVKFTKAPKMFVAYVERKGPYTGTGEAMRSLKKWIDSKGIEQAGYPFCLFYDDPGKTPAADLRSEACIPVGKTFAPEGEFKSKELGETDVAEFRHEAKPGSYGEAYGPFLEGLVGQGYLLTGPAREYYMSANDVTGPGAGFLIQQPVSKA